MELASAPGGILGSLGMLRVVKLFRRVLLVLGVAAAIGGLARVVGKGTVEPTRGGWRQLDDTTFR